MTLPRASLDGRVKLDDPAQKRGARYFSLAFRGLIPGIAGGCHKRAINTLMEFKMPQEMIFDGAIVLRSQSDKYRMKIEVSDDGSLLATLLIRDPKDPNRWDPQGSGQGRKLLAQAVTGQLNARSPVIINLR